MKKNLAIVFGITDNYAFALANVLIGMKKHCKKFWDDIIVYHIGLPKKEQENLNKILECKFIDFNELSEKLKVNEQVKKEYSLLTFARFECFNLLKEYKKVMWQDVDILVQQDLEGLLEYGNKSGFAATLAVDNFYVESNFKKLILDYNMFTPLYNAGILCLTDKLKGYENFADWCYEKTCEYCDIIRFPDQGIINLLIQEFNIEVEHIDILKYCCHPNKKEVYDSAIVHAYGSNKFWNSLTYQKMFPEWLENNKEWEKINNNKITKNINNKPLVSVIMSVYTRYNYLKESIMSILEQTYENLELIIVIEKSEKSKEISQYIKEFADSRVKIIINDKKLGFPESLNVAIRNSKGKYIARMDDDDISLPTRIEKQVTFMEENEEIGISGTFMKMFMKCEDLCTKPLNDEQLKAYSLTNNPFFHPTIIMRKNVIEENNLYYSSEYFTEDYELWTRAIKYTKFANIDEVLLRYRASGENATIQFGQKVHASVINIMDRQFKETLDLKFNKNELELLYGKTTGLYNYLYNLEESLVIYNNLLDKIIEANLKLNFYNQNELEKIFDKETVVIPRKSSIFKRIIKRILRPIYSRLINRVENIINARILENNTLIYTELNNIKDELKDKDN